MEFDVETVGLNELLNANYYSVLFTDVNAFGESFNGIFFVVPMDEFLVSLRTL